MKRIYLTGYGIFLPGEKINALQKETKSTSKADKVESFSEIDCILAEKSTGSVISERGFLYGYAV